MENVIDKDLNVSKEENNNLEEISESTKSNDSSQGKKTLKDLWKRFIAWKERTGKKIDLWSRKKPFRRKLYLNRTLYLMMFPYVLLFTVFTVLPVVMSFGLSFTYFNLLEAPRWVGFSNYLTLFLDDDIFITAVKNTLIIAVVTGPIGYLLSFVFAWLINELPPKIKPFITLAFYAPSLAGNAILIWTLIFNSDIYGYANSFLIQFGFIAEPITWLQNSKYILPIIIVVQLWMSLGVNFLALIAGLKSVDKTQYEAAAVDGVRNRWQELWFITLPNMKPQLTFSAVIQISASLGVGAISTALAGFPSIEYSGHTIINHLTDYGSVRFEMGYASAIATLLFVTAILLNKAIQKIIRKVGT
ncbi:MAG: carbohydrate ABC transporter permease [Bacilli bacterium]|jgi:multiple sugar transport system permease protein